MTEDLMTLEELVAELTRLLEAAGIDQRNRQVSTAPNERTVRYYTSIGIMDPPAAHRNRRALYGQRHLFQVLAIKRLQSEQGLPLDHMQRRLAGLPTEELRRIAAVPSNGSEEPASDEHALARPVGAPRGDFWTAAPAEPSGEPPPHGAPYPGLRLLALDLGRGATLLVPAEIVPVDPRPDQVARAGRLMFEALGLDAAAANNQRGADGTTSTQEETL